MPDRSKLRRCRAVLLALVLGVSVELPAQDGPSLTQGTYEQLNSIRQQLDEGDAAKATRRLRTLAEQLQDIPYDQAVTYRTLGYAQASAGDYAAAAEAFGRALALEALPEDERVPLYLAHGQMLMADGQYRAAADALERYRQAAESPKDTALLLLGNAYLQLERYTRARDTLQALIRRSEAPEEDWYRLLFAAHYELGEYRQALAVMKKLVAMAPDEKGYWQNLASLYSRLERRDEALAVQALMYRRGMLAGSDELLNLVRMYLNQGQPLRAGEVLEREIAAGRIPDTVEHQRLLAQAWIQARENDKAIEVLAAAAPRASTGELYLQLAQRYYHRQDWQKVVENVDAALRKGGLEEPGHALVLKGVAHYRAGDRGSAAGAFARARQHQKTRQRAEQWLDHLEASS